MIEPKNLSPAARQAFRRIEFDRDERLLLEIRKHPFGLFLIYLVGTFVIVSMLLIGVSAAFIPSETPELGFDGGVLRLPLVLVGFILAVLAMVATAIGAYLYNSNVMLVTSEKISQLIHISIFHKKISQLSIGDVQDVTVTQKGIFAHTFNYGTIVIETAGEQQNYTFTFSPNPYAAAKIIVGSHEENLKEYGN